MKHAWQLGFRFFLYTILFGVLLQTADCVPFRKAKGVVFGPSSSNKILFVDSRFEEKEREMIQESVNEWQSTTKGLATFRIIWDFDVENEYPSVRGMSNVLIAYKANSKEPVFVEMEESGKVNQTLGLYHYRDHVPTISIVHDRLEFTMRDYYRGVIIHELGHSMGLPHFNIKNTIMYPSMDESSYHLTKDDLELFCDYYGCNVDQMWPKKE